MRNVTRAFGFLLTFLIPAAHTSAQDSGPYFSQHGVTFYPESGVLTNIVINGRKVDVIIEQSGNTRASAVSWEGETPLKLRVADYNFDGKPDFSVYRLDEGMGTYEVYRIFLFDTNQKEFHELRPKCGDGYFINVKLSNRKERFISNSYVRNNEWKTCKMPFR